MGPGGGPCMVSLYSEVQVVTSLSMSWGRVVQYSEVRSTSNMFKHVQGRGPRHITFDTPLTGGENINQGSIEFYLRITGCEFAV